MTRERVAAAGEFFSFGQVPVVPRPLTRPHPPVVVAATSAGTAELAAARGLPMLLGMHVDDAGKQDMIIRYQAAAARQQDRLPAGGHMAAVVAQVITGTGPAPGSYCAGSFPLAAPRAGRLRPGGRLAAPGACCRTPMRSCCAGSTGSAPPPTAPGS